MVFDGGLQRYREVDMAIARGPSLALLAAMVIGSSPLLASGSLLLRLLF